MYGNWDQFWFQDITVWEGFINGDAWNVLDVIQVALNDHIIDQGVLANTKQYGRGKLTEIVASQIRLLGKILAEEIGKRISEVSST